MNTLRETIKSMFIRRGFGKRIVIPLIKENGSKQNLVYELEDIISAIINIYE